jgi:U3 small nucleolar RNA-associated protein 3
MGKKRKTSGQTKDSEIQHSSKLTLNSWEDVADSEDEFLINRDKILLNEGWEVKRRRKLQEEGIGGIA